MNIEKSVAESFSGLGYWTTSTSQDAQAQVKAKGAVIRVSQVGGPVDDIAGDYRCVFEVYAKTYDQMWATASVVEDRLNRGHFRAGEVYVDKTDCESSFAERPLTQGTRVLVATWLLTARHNTRRPVVAP
jgi:hypothetical protein